MRRSRSVALIATLLALLLLAGQVSPAWGWQATPETVVVDATTETSITFPEGMSFGTTIELPGRGEISAVQLLYRMGSDETLNLEIIDPGEFTIDGRTLRIDAFVDLLTNLTPVGVELRFQWEILLADGWVVTTGEESAQWMDTRMEWDLAESDQIRLYTYDTSDDFAEMMLAESQATVDELEARYVLEQIPPLTIWVYPDFDDFRGTFQGNSREAIAGVSYPGLDTIMAVVGDGDEREFGRVIPHEISHQVLFAATDNAYAHPPLWFDEGIATHTQIGGTDLYPTLVADAQGDDTLFRIDSLEASFPYQPQQATLAYASSWSMITYIEATWGPEGIARLIDAFAVGSPPDEAVETALGLTMDDLDAGWKAWIEVNAATD